MIGTYLTLRELEVCDSVKDEELNHLLHQVRIAFNNAYYVQERHFFTGLLRKKQRMLYTVFWDMKNGEQQIINFATDDGPSLNTAVTRSVVMNYFQGLLNGYTYAKTKNKA